MSVKQMRFKNRSLQGIIITLQWRMWQVGEQCSLCGVLRIYFNSFNTSTYNNVTAKVRRPMLGSCYTRKPWKIKFLTYRGFLAWTRFWETRDKNFFPGRWHSVSFCQTANAKVWVVRNLKLYPLPSHSRI